MVLVFSKGIGPCSTFESEGTITIWFSRSRASIEEAFVKEATVGFEPTHGGFADPCLTRLGYVAVQKNAERHALSARPMAH